MLSRDLEHVQSARETAGRPVQRVRSASKQGPHHAHTRNTRHHQQATKLHDLAEAHTPHREHREQTMTASTFPIVRSGSINSLGNAQSIAVSEARLTDPRRMPHLSRALSSPVADCATMR